MSIEPSGDEPRVPREPGQEELRKEMRAQFGKRLLQTSIAAILILILVFSAVGVYLIRTTQVGNRTTLKEARDASSSSARTADRIEDCTTPGGDCFERAQRSTSGAVAGINTITVRATACLAVVLKSIPDGTEVNVDEVALQIQRCIRTATTSVKPQTVVPAPKPDASTTTVPSTSTSTKPKKHKHPKATGTPGVPTPTPAPADDPGLLDQVCNLVPLLCP